MAGFGAVLDACVLVPVALCDTLLRLAEYELYRPVWTSQILHETRRAIVEVHPDLDPSRVDARLQAMNQAFEDACVTQWDRLIDDITLPDPDDRHVVAAAIRGRAELIVTANLRDFPSNVLDPLGLHALSADDFLLDQLDLHPPTTIHLLHEQAADQLRPPTTIHQILDALAAAGTPRFAAEVRTRM